MERTSNSSGCYLNPLRVSGPTQNRRLVLQILMCSQRHQRGENEECGIPWFREIGVKRERHHTDSNDSSRQGKRSLYSFLFLFFFSQFSILFFLVGNSFFFGQMSVILYFSILTIGGRSKHTTGAWRGRLG